MTSVNSFKRPSLIILSLISLFLVSHKSIGQSRIQLSGMVVDAENSIPVPYAYVSLQDVALGTVTNGDGRFAINIPGNYVQQNIVFSYVGYERQVISITELQSREKIVIKLNPDVKVLREVVVKPRKPIKAKTLLKRVINRIPDNYPDESMLMNAYYRETITENGAYIKYADASVQYNYAPYKKGGFKWREYANAYGGVAGSLSRLNNYAGSRLHRIHFHQRTLKEDQVKIIDSRASADLTKTRMHANIEGGPMGILARDRVKFQKSFLGGKKFKKFNYELGEVIDEHGDWVYVLSFKTVITPEELDKLKKKSIKQWSKANSYKLLQGKIYIDQNDYAILKYECSVPNELKKYFCGYKTMAIKHFDYKLEATYKKKDDKYYIDKLRHEDEFIYTDTVANNTTPYAAVSEVYMTNVQPAGQKFDFKETLENIDANQLYDYPLEYNTKFWEDYTKNTPIAEIPEQIRKDMEVGKKLEQQFVDKHTRDENLTPPVAKIKTKETPIHGEVIKDDYAWLKDTKSPLSNQEVMDYIESENKYAENYFIPLRRSQRSLYDELSSRVNKNIESLPFKQDGYEYTTKYTADDEYPVYLRNKVGSSEKEVIMDVNKMAEEREGYYSAGIIEVSPNTKITSFYENTDGSDKIVIKFKNLESGELLTDSLVDVSGVIWINNETLLYTEQEKKTNRTYKVKRHTLGTSQKQDPLIYEEKDRAFSLGLYKSRSKKFIYLSIASSSTSEFHFLKVSDPFADFQIVTPREKGHQYSVTDYKDDFYILTDRNNPNFDIVKTSSDKPGIKNWKKFRNAPKGVMLTSLTLFDNYTVLRERENTQSRIRVIDNRTSKEHIIKFKEDIHTVGVGYNPDTDTDTLRITYQSMKTPVTVYNYHMGTKKKKLVRKQRVPFFFAGKWIKQKRVWATAKDGKKIPITLLYRQWDVTKKRPHKRLFLTSYGSYGASASASFDHTVYSLINRGFVYAIAHVRGGSDMGMEWYEDGKLLKKKNTFTDFITCAEYLIEEGYTEKGSIVAQGGSAGGLLMGAIANMRPDLFKVIILDVPFVDVVNTMLDDQLPLTTLEYEEWGSPLLKKYYKYMKSYSPYDNVTAQEYPNMLFFTGINDSRVGYWEPAKMVAKLRKYKTDDNLLLLKTELSSGHGGGSGRYSRYRDLAYKYALIFDLFATDIKDAVGDTSP